MSVIIKGMDMPKNCGECPLAEATAELYCNNYVLSLEERPEWCPLEEVKEEKMARPNSQPCAICRNHKRMRPFTLKADNGEQFEITHICNCPFCGRFLEENYRPLTAADLEEKEC